MTLADTFATWKSGVLVGLGAPDDANTTDALWAWSQAEGGVGHNNPLNTTYFEAGAVPWNTLSGGLHVWIYLTIQDGINATVVTLLNPDPAVGLPNGYDIIVDHLRRSIPRAQWGDACWQLDKWGTGCGWLTTDYGAAPGTLGEIDLTPEEHGWLQNVQEILQVLVGAGNIGQGVQAFRLANLQDVQSKVDALSASVSGLTPAQAQLLQDAHDAILRIEASLKAA